MSLQSSGLSLSFALPSSFLILLLLVKIEDFIDFVSKFWIEGHFIFFFSSFSGNKAVEFLKSFLVLCFCTSFSIDDLM